MKIRKLTINQRINCFDAENFSKFLLDIGEGKSNDLRMYVELPQNIYRWTISIHL